MNAESLILPAAVAPPSQTFDFPQLTPAKPKNYTGLVGMAGYKAWVAPLLEIEYACKTFEGYAEALASIAQKREAMRHADITGPIGKTAGWSPSGNFKVEFEMPYVAALLFKAAFGLDALQQPKVKRLIRQNHPEFCYLLRR